MNSCSGELGQSVIRRASIAMYIIVPDNFIHVKRRIEALGIKGKVSKVLKAIMQGIFKDLRQ
jgi:hypothetical protein